MACAPALPAEFVEHDADDAQSHDQPVPARRGCRCRVKRTAKDKTTTSSSKLAGNSARGMAIVMSIASTLALTLAMLQLADGQAGKAAAQTLYLAAGFNVLFTLLYTPLVALFTLRAGFWRAVRALFGTFFTGLAYTLGLLFVSVVLLVALSSVFG